MMSATDFCEKIFDGTHDSPKPSKRGFKLLTSKNIMNGYLDKDSAYYITEEDYNKVNVRSKIQKYDILFSMIGTIGNVCIVTDDNIDFAIKNMGVFRCKSKSDAYLLYYYLQSPYAKKVIKNMLNGAVQKFMSLEMLRNFPIAINKDISNNIEILKMIDEKISLNNLAIEKLLKVSRIIYDYWFIQFKYPNSSSNKNIYCNELRRNIPEIFEYKKLSEIESNIITGKTPSTRHKEYFNGDIPFITIDDIRNNIFITETSRCLSNSGANSQKNKFLPQGSICVSCIGTPGIIGFTIKPSQTNQQINSIIIENDYNRYFLYLALNVYFDSSNNVKTGNIFSNMNKEDFSNIKILYNEKLVKNFNEVIKTNFEKIKYISIENYDLLKMKEFVMPLIINGQISL